MLKKAFILFTTSLTAMAVTDFPPDIPDGQITYDEVSYQSGASELPAEFVSGGGNYEAPVAPAAAPAPSSTPRTVINLLAYATNYQVRGMGVTNGLSRYGTSNLSASHTFANRNLFRKGIQHRVHGMVGGIWNASSPLGEIPQFELGYGVGKEVLPNFLIEVGYNFRRGGLEGFMAQTFDRASHRSTQDITLTLSYNDFQKGFFGHAQWGVSFYGLTGNFFDVELGYRFANVIRSPRMGADLEVSVGVAPSVSYWGSGVEGVDAYRVKIGVLPFSQNGKFGRDGHFSIKPWVQCSWSGHNAAKIARHTGYGLVDHFQITFGLDVGLKF